MFGGTQHLGSFLILMKISCKQVLIPSSARSTGKLGIPLMHKEGMLHQVWTKSLGRYEGGSCTRNLA